MRTELQGTEKWHADRSGRVTASRFKDVVAWGKPDKNGKREPMGARTSYMRELCFERLAKKSKHNVSSASIKWGHTEEQKAQDAYEMLTGNIVIPSKFIVHPKYDWLGCSPDGLINDDGGTTKRSANNPSISGDGDFGPNDTPAAAAVFEACFAGVISISPPYESSNSSGV